VTPNPPPPPPPPTLQMSPRTKWRLVRFEDVNTDDIISCSRNTPRL
jgi:hypothetical protein